MEEQWLPAPGWEGLYSVSNLGRVRSEDRITTFADGRVKRFPGKVLSPSRFSRTGYPYVTFTSGARRQRWSVHRLVLTAFVGEAPGMVCRHLDGTCTNNRLDNLCWGTVQENAQDRQRHGRYARGEAQPISKLTEDDVRMIRFRYAAGDGTHRSLARDFGVVKTSIANIVNGRTWKHVT